VSDLDRALTWARLWMSDVPPDADHPLPESLHEIARALLAEHERVLQLTGLLFTGLPTEEVDVNADPFDVANRVIARADQQEASHE